MKKDIWVVSCVYTAEYGALALDYQTVYLDETAAVASVMARICETYLKVGRINITDHEFEEIKAELKNSGEHRHDFHDGNNFLWTFTRMRLEITEDT